jgi:hypothetical protein
MSKIKDINLWESGKQKIEWVKRIWTFSGNRGGVVQRKSPSRA